MRYVGFTGMLCISVIYGGTDIGSALTAGRFFFGKSNQNHLLRVWPSCVGFPHSGDAPWARAERTSMSRRSNAGVEGTPTKEGPDTGARRFGYFATTK
jgi:hypothetical protein